MQIERMQVPGQLEPCWDGLAQALNRVGPEKGPVLLAKLVLLLAATLPGPDGLQPFIDAALRDIAPDSSTRQDIP